MPDRAAAAFSLQLRAVSSSLSGLLCGPNRDYSFLSGAWTRHHGDGTLRDKKTLSALKFCRQSVELCDVNVACKCICDSHRMYCHIFQLCINPPFVQGLFFLFCFLRQAFLPRHFRSDDSGQTLQYEDVILLLS